MTTQLLRPGLMIALQSRCKGGVEYELEESETLMEGEKLTQKRKSTKTVFDLEEHERAVKIRGKALYEIRKCCVKTPFSLLCPNEREAELDVGVEKAQTMVREFNSTSTHTKISLYVMKAILMGNDEETVRGVAAEMRQLLSEMSAAVEKLDPEAIRETIQKANELSQMFQENEKEKVSLAIELARSAAREITKAVNKKGSVALPTVEDFRMELSAINNASMAFLDFEAPAQVSAENEVPQVEVQDLDMGTVDVMSEPRQEGYGLVEAYVEQLDLS